MGWFSRKETATSQDSPLLETLHVEDKKVFFSLERLKHGLQKTRSKISAGLKNLFAFKKAIDEGILEELESLLIQADMGVRSVNKIIEDIRTAWKSKEIRDTDEIYNFLKDRLKKDMSKWNTELNYAQAPPTVIMVAGVNGVGKTTSIAKLAHLLSSNGNKVMLAAGDTFRAAAVEQLEIWSKRIGVEIVKHQLGSDPGAVVFDALEASIARKIDYLIIDTAGRLHTHENLMKELSKIKRVVAKRINGAPHEVILVLDSTTGQNAITQAKLFNQAIDITGIFLTKLDGTAKGGVVLGMQDEINIPVKFIGIGEKAEDIEPFNPSSFVEAIFA